MISSVGNLYESIQNLADSYLLPNQVKNSLLHPTALLCATDMPLVLSGTQNRTPYVCPDRHPYVGDVPNSLCPLPYCKKKMTTKFNYVPSAASKHRDTC
ncbi:hypothetical protein Patl1_06277 [Pistacia atlantica]|uniref:Uncharacterized protein n=1 Tax=Pistacia atlantica TaxID=434234 RepID=A0ACC1BQH4_9ROSI|nr:hypothetical protein Patl1_06277 [Pistacia atlantica]